MNPKWLALISLVLQNSSLAILMRWTYVHTSSRGLYIASTAVLITEVMKLLISIIFCYLVDSKSNISKLSTIVTDEIFGNIWDWINLTVPSILYTIQNNLQYLSMSQLSAPVFQLLYQMKIVTTALFSVILLSKRITIMQWMSILSLTSGVALVQLSQQQNKGNNLSNNSLIGFISVLCGSITSGFAGVYFEMILKNSSTSLWVRNIQLSSIGVITSLISCLSKDGSSIYEKGFFTGYTHLVWSVILMQAAGGIIVALVVKYADNVMKVFATSLSIIVTSYISWQLFHDFQISFGFLMGTSIILFSIFLFTGNTNIPIKNCFSYTKLDDA